MAIDFEIPEDAKAVRLAAAQCCGQEGLQEAATADEAVQQAADETGRERDIAGFDIDIVAGMHEDVRRGVSRAAAAVEC